MQGQRRLAIINTMQNLNSEPSASEGNAVDFSGLVGKIKARGLALGFAEVGIASTEVSTASAGLRRWLALGRHGGMNYMAKHAELRASPQLLVPGTASIISARMPYWPQAVPCEQVLADRELGYISRYALGRDYHKTVRQRLQKLAEYLLEEAASLGLADAFAYRVFSDSAPVMEVELARQAGIAWRGKHTLTLSRKGSWHFLGDIFTTLPLPPDAPIEEHCGDCQRCLDCCPTQAIIAPYEVDARLCISYLTIELQGSIPVELRQLMGNRIYGCDDCQLYCPWNRFATLGDPDFAVRHALDGTSLTTLFSWSEETFEQRLAGSPIRRIGHERWLRNIAVALGNAPASASVVAALLKRRDDSSALVREHIEWALARQIPATQQLPPGAAQCA